MRKWEETINALSDKDKRALILLTLFLVPLIAYFIILRPSYGYYSAAKESYSENKALLEWVDINSRRIATNPQEATVKTALPLLELLTTSADKNVLKITRIQPESDNKVRVWLDEAEFAKLIAWLTELTGSGVTISSISIDKTNEPGFVNTQCLFSKMSDK